MFDSIVVDASVGVRIADRNQPGHAAALDALTTVLRLGAEPVAPDLYAYEVGNAISRFGDPAPERARLYLRALEIVSVAQPTVETFLRALDVASSRRLTFYDAAYVALADDRQAPLWTEDRAILKQCSDLAIDSATLTARARGR